jgi:hypothetical protein
MNRVLSLWRITLPLSLVTMIFAAAPIVDLRITQAHQDLGTLQFAIDNYKAKHGRLPTESDGLTAVIGPSFHQPIDPWGQPYVYRRADGTDSYLIYSRGLDGVDDRGLGDDVMTGAKTYKCADYGVNCFPAPRDIVMWLGLLVFAASLVVGIVRIAATLRRWLAALIRR